MPIDPEHLTSGQHPLAQIISEVLQHSQPWLSDVSEATKDRYRSVFLDGLEDHIAGLTGDLIAKLVDQGDPPPEVLKILNEIRQPTEQFTGIVNTLFLYGLVMQISSTMLAPFVQQVQNNIWSANPTRPLDPATLAVGAVRGLAPGGQAIVNVPSSLFQIANETGISNEDFQFLADIGGNPPSPQELLEMFRREIIGMGTVDGGGLTVATGLQEGDTRDEWIEAYQKLAYAWLTPLDFVRAAVQAQMTYSDAQAWAAKTGLDTTTSIPINGGDSEATPDMFGLAFSIAGRPPGPEEAGRMANRGIIDWTGTGAGSTSFAQVIAESDVKTKYTAALQALQSYIPPPRMVTNLLKGGGITAAQAQKYWEMSGVPVELAQAYVFEATHQATVQEKELAKGDILTGYYDGIISQDDATELLGLLGYVGDVATTMIDITDMRREIKAINSEVTAVASYYKHYKITETVAQQALKTLGIPDSQITGLLSIWAIDRTVPNRIPSASEIGKAVEYGTLTQTQGIAALQQLGYTLYDAAIVLSATSEAQVTLPAGQTPPAVDV